MIIVINRKKNQASDDNESDDVFDGNNHTKDAEKIDTPKKEEKNNLCGPIR